jgi:uncharacterized protein (TIGR02145 family)
MELILQMLAEESVLDSNIKYGALYNWFAVETGKLAPQGWAIPTDAEFTTFTTYINNNYNPGGVPGVGNVLKHRRKNGAPVEAGFDTSVQPRWDAHATHYGRDTLNFGWIPGGARSAADGSYSLNGSHGLFMTSTKTDAISVWRRFTSNGINSVTRDFDSVKRGLSVRCFRPATTTEQSFPDGRLCANARDVDGNVYNTVKIGSGVDAKVWMIQNLATTKYNDGSAIPNVTDNAAWAALSTAAYCWYDNDKATNGVYAAIKDTIFTRTLYRAI